MGSARVGWGRVEWGRLEWGGLEWGEGAAHIQFRDLPLDPTGRHRPGARIHGGCRKYITKSLPIEFGDLLRLRFQIRPKCSVYCIHLTTRRPHFLFEVFGLLGCILLVFRKAGLLDELGKQRHHVLPQREQSRCEQSLNTLPSLRDVEEGKWYVSEASRRRTRHSGLSSTVSSTRCSTSPIICGVGRRGDRGEKEEAWTDADLTVKRCWSRRSEH